MAANKPFLLSLSSSLLMLLLLVDYLFQTCDANCPPSACGIFRNISYPFRLKDDPKHCGDRRAELACENNVTYFYLNSHKYYVKEINYEHDYSATIIRVVDASININDICSFPNYSDYAAVAYDFPYSFTPIGQPINFMSCPYPLKNSSLFTDISHCTNFSLARFTYVKVGHMIASDVPETCRLDLISTTNLYAIDSNDVLSLSEIHDSLLYGFELLFCRSCKYTKWEKLVDFFDAKLRRPLLILLVIVVLSGAVATPVMTIIGFTLILALLLTIVHFQFH